MTRKVILQRLAAGVPGLADVLGGGLPEFSFNLIAGQPGCGKTTLAHQLMFALATSKRSAIYFTVLGEPPLKMLRYQQQFEFFDTEAIVGEEIGCYPVNPANPSYVLPAGSPCIDRGASGTRKDTTAILKDIDGRARNQGLAPDIGAYERQ